MLRIATSGHRGIPPQSTRLVEAEIRARLADQPSDVVALSCLADGPDQIFALAVLDHGGSIEAVVPAEQYRDGLPEDAHAEYDALIGHAIEIHRMPYVESASEAHMAASAYMVDHADELWAVWDGKPARGYGGTADVVAYARDKGVAVRVIWPEGATRDP
jgi:hypothetical protein